MDWQHATGDISLSNTDVHIWRVSLMPNTTLVKAMKSLLSPDEIQRAERFRFQRDHDRFVLSRGSLRQILGRYTNRKPESVEFAYDTLGKPSLRDTDCLVFNVSHASDTGLIAITRQHRIGIDVEYIRPMPYLKNIATHYFSTQEAAALERMPDDIKLPVFFIYWTAKEAISKALGKGLSMTLSAIQIDVQPDFNTRIISIPDEDISTWSIIHFCPAPDYQATLAVHGLNRLVSGWCFDTFVR